MKDAMLAVTACQIVYNGDGDELVDCLSLSDVHTKSWEELFVAVGHSLDANWIVFQGTNSWMDWAYNCNAKMICTLDFPGKVHAGFYEAYTDLVDWVAKKIDTKKPCILAGHSLGGALATLMSCHVAGEVYSFGSPRVGDADFASAYKETHYRYVRQFDVVPYVPLFGSHVGQLIELPGAPFSAHRIAGYKMEVACLPILT